MIPFHFAEGKKRAKAAEAEWEDSILAVLPKTWNERLGKEDATYTGSGERNVLQKHLRNYTKKNTSDYFIHKDLGGFLRRELDFYIKNEVMFLDDIESRPTSYLESELRKIKAIRAVAHDLIDFMKQFEDFQKKLWLKKKFVVETNWCITLDRIPEEFYTEIAACDLQREEWVELFSIHEIQGDLVEARYSVPLTEEFLRKHSSLPVNTGHFPPAVRARMISSFDDLENASDGVLVCSDNSDALSLLHARFANSIQCVFVDPPYNTGSDEFIYKDGYQSSSWLSLLLPRCEYAKNLMSDTGLFFMQIGDDEAARSRMFLEDVFVERKNTTVVRRGVKNVQAQFSDIDKLSEGHDIIHVFAKHVGVRVPHLRHKLDEVQAGKWDTFWRGVDRPTMRYELLGHNPETGQWRWETGRAHRAVENYRSYLENESEHKSLDEWYVEMVQAGQELNFVRLNEEGVVQYFVPPQAYRLVSDNWLDVPSAGNITEFAHEKSLGMLQRVIEWNTKQGDYCLDFFAGSGSTGHAALKSGRRFAMVEMGEHFYSALLPRMLSAVHALQASSSFKYIRLESYEDTLNNLALYDQTPDLLGQSQDLQDEYLLRYCLDTETNGSLLDCEQFKDPFNYQLKIYDRESGEAKPTKVDLPETFNYLLGLKVRTMQMKEEALVIEGENPAGETVLVIWRNVEAMDNAKLDAFVSKTLRINTADTEYAAIYINGDTTLNDPHKKILLTEQVFHDLMFDVEDV